MKKQKEQSFETGVYLLETLTSGMYNNPLMIYREYIQNAVDSIDNSYNNGSKKPTSKYNIDIKLDPINKSILIGDNAHGISSNLAKDFLSNIGSSAKTGTAARGFRGIGRLGGIAFCDKITFTTSSPGQKTVSKQVWDCIKLREVLGNGNGKKSNMSDVLDTNVTFKQSRAEKKDNTYFTVLLEGVSSYRNVLLDIQKVRKYLTEVTPLPFNYSEFSYASQIEKYLKSNVADYRTYTITLNGQRLYKPYTNEVPVMKGRNDRLTGVRLNKLETPSKELLAVYWIATREQMKGALCRGDLRGGIKVRVGDILLGDSHLLNQYFREARFNHYCVGEIHIVSDKLIPNGRRDDFIDNDYKALFYREIERVIGLLLSKEIREKSREPYSGSACKLQTLKPANLPQTKQKSHKTDSDKLDSIINEIIAQCNDCSKAEKIAQLINEQ